MPVDNDYYNRAPTAWRDARQPLSLLEGITPARFVYLRHVLVERIGMNLRDSTVLDVGCGGGLLAEEFARAGCRVTGIDPSEPSLKVARAHAADARADIEYLQGTGEALPLDDASFDAVYCCDVLEHVNDLDRVIAEIARVLKPGGAFLYDTINRTFASNLVFIKLTQDWRVTRIVDFSLHDWKMFIRPEELWETLAQHGLQNKETVGFGPRVKPWKVLAAFWDLKRGRTGYPTLAKSLDTGVTGNLRLSYMGYAIKANGREQPAGDPTIER